MARPIGLDVEVVAPPGQRRPAGLGPWLASVAPRAAHGTVTVALVDDRRMRALNRRFRAVDAVTDVLSFPAAAVATASRGTGSTRPSADRAVIGGASLGDIVIAIGVARRQAAAEGHGFGTECRVLALHGLLHLLGYDHAVDQGDMARVEARLRRRGGLPAGLIGRSQTTPRTRRRR